MSATRNKDEIVEDLSKTLSPEERTKLSALLSLEMKPISHSEFEELLEKYKRNPSILRLPPNESDVRLIRQLMESYINNDPVLGGKIESFKKLQSFYHVFLDDYEKSHPEAFANSTALELDFGQLCRPDKLI